MIRRKSSKIVDSIVNSAYEEHFNVTKSIRDDAPITDTTSVLKSINFESDLDGAYSLRKPLVKHQTIKSNLPETNVIVFSQYGTEYTTPARAIRNKVILFDKKTYLNVDWLYHWDGTTYRTEYEIGPSLDPNDTEEGSIVYEERPEPSIRTTSYQLSMPNMELKLRYYNMDLVLKEVPISFNNAWLTELDKKCDLEDCSLFRACIKHDLFRNEFSDNLTNINLTNVYRLIKVYPHETLANTYVVEIVFPEYNTITSGLDTNNASTLDINLLLDNPYATRDLYGYGYVSTTKILPYVAIDDDSGYTKESVSNLKVYDLTEAGDLRGPESKRFTILASANPTTFNKRFLVLKAFLTTAITDAELWCCWEESTNDGIDWKECPDFIDKVESNPNFIVKSHKVSDLTYENFNEAITKETLERATSYLVDKKLVKLNLDHRDFYQEDAIKDRPDVLVLEYPSLNKMYRFQIYTVTKKQTPTPGATVSVNADDESTSTFKPIQITSTITESNFKSTSGDFTDESAIKFSTNQHTSATEPYIEDNCIVLREGTTTRTDPAKAPTVGWGSSLRVYTEDSSITINSVSVTLAASEQSGDTSWKNVGAFIRVTPDDVDNNELSLSSEYYTADIGNVESFTTTQELLPGYSLNLTYGYPVPTGADNSDWATLDKVNTNIDLFSRNFYTISNYSKNVTLSNIEANNNVVFTNIANAVYETENIAYITNLGQRYRVFCPFIFIQNSSNPTLIGDGTVANFKISLDSPDKSLETAIVAGIGNQNGIRIAILVLSSKQDNYQRPYASIDKYYIDMPNAMSADGTALNKFIIEAPVFMESIKSNGSSSNVNIKTSPFGGVSLGDKGFYLEVDDVKEIKNILLKAFNEQVFPIYTEIAGNQDINISGITTITKDNTNYLFDNFKTPNTNLSVSSYSQIPLKIKNISVTYTKTYSEEDAYVDEHGNIHYPTTNIYLTSSTGGFKVNYGTSYQVVKSLKTKQRSVVTGDTYYNTNQKQLLIYAGDTLYVSNTDSAIVKFMNVLTFPETITKILNWRNYTLVFTPKHICLCKYDSGSDTYLSKTLSNSVGVNASDADTVVPILNSIYFKSGDKIYRLVPNLYASSDDNLNIHTISSGINTFLEYVANNLANTKCFAWANSDVYNIYIAVNPDAALASSKYTYCVSYNLTKQIWNIFKYPVALLNIEKISNDTAYLKDDTNEYYYNTTLKNLLLNAQTFVQGTSGIDIDTVLRALPYGDYINHSPRELISFIKTTDISANIQSAFANVVTPFEFEIDFGQKSTNYTMDKQYLESKLILATYFSKDTFPLELDISTDGISRTLHIDANSDAAVQKNNLDETNALSTWFESNNTNYSGILRQLIVKYSGKGKSIRHRIHGSSKTLFKFYSMDVRSRILPKKH